MAKISPTAALGTTPISSGFTHAQFVTWLKDGFTACGFPTVNEDFTGGTTILAYDINLDAGFTYGRVAFIVKIPPITNGVDFTVQTGLCHYTSYDFVNFEYTANFVNAGGGVTVASGNLAAATDFVFNNDNGYTPFAFDTTLEFIGLFIKQTSGDDTLIASLGMMKLENYYSDYDRNANSFIALLCDNFASEAISDAIPTSPSNAAFSLAPPFQGSTVASSNNGVILTPMFYRQEQGLASSFGRAGSAQVINAYPQTAYDTSNTDREHILFGNASSDILVGFGDFNCGDIIEVTAGVEEYFVIQGYGTGGKAVLLIQIDLP